MSDPLRPHGLQYTRPPCPSPSPGVYPNSCPLSQWCHPTISSSVVPFSRLQSFPASASFQMSQFLASGGQSVGASSYWSSEYEHWPIISSNLCSNLFFSSNLCLSIFLPSWCSKYSHFHLLLFWTWDFPPARIPSFHWLPGDTGICLCQCCSLRLSVMMELSALLCPVWNPLVICG